MRDKVTPRLIHPNVCFAAAANAPTTLFFACAISQESELSDLLEREMRFPGCTPVSPPRFGKNIRWKRIRKFMIFSNSGPTIHYSHSFMDTEGFD
ncbi:hypothetical protein CDAR_615931 [Caerostris darwini]|uniref:Uncharacterized protein n=1 Tax=Caerostris darwini TaxID=1538125 RepID=A0AAV4RU62_9ARAC|nr:hypothetical protein CDAR_615931 [Caerostris darwini]